MEEKNSAEGRQYASLIQSLLPIAGQLLGGGGGSSGIPVSALLNMAGPIINQVRF